MVAHANARYMRVSSIKVRQVIDLIRGKNVENAVAILAHVDKGCTKMVSKVLNSAISNAKQTGVMEDQMFISFITANHGPSWKRFRAAAFGRAAGIRKKTTHLKIELSLITH